MEMVVADAELLVKRERLATLLFERLDDVPNYVVARRLADLVLERLRRERGQLPHV